MPRMEKQGVFTAIRSFSKGEKRNGMEWNGMVMNLMNGTRDALHTLRNCNNTVLRPILALRSST